MPPRNPVHHLAVATPPLLQQRLSVLYRHLPGGIAGVERDLHEMRVAARRLRVALPLLVERAGGRRVTRSRRLLRGLVQAGGRGRDLDVMLRLLAGPLLAGVTRERVVRLRRSLRSAHARSRGATAAALMDVDIALLRRDLRALAARDGESVFGALARVRGAREALAGELIEAIDALGDRFQPERLHWLRRRLRRLRYTAELQGELVGRRLQAPRQLKRLQAQLGQLNDAWVLAQWLAGRAAAADRRGDAGLAGAARRLRARAVAVSRRSHAAWLASTPRDALRAALSSMGSQPEPVTGLATSRSAGDQG